MGNITGVTATMKSNLTATYLNQQRGVKRTDKSRDMKGSFGGSGGGNKLVVDCVYKQCSWKGKCF